MRLLCSLRSLAGWPPPAVRMLSAVRNGSPCFSRPDVGFMFALRDTSCFRTTAEGDHPTDMRRLCTLRSLHSLPISPWAESDDTARTTFSQRRAEPAVKISRFFALFVPLSATATGSPVLVLCVTGRGVMVYVVLVGCRVGGITRTLSGALLCLSGARSLQFFLLFAPFSLLFAVFATGRRRSRSPRQIPRILPEARRTRELQNVMNFHVGGDPKALGGVRN